MTRRNLGLMINLHLSRDFVALHALEAAQNKGLGRSSARVEAVAK